LDLFSLFARNIFACIVVSALLSNHAYMNMEWDIFVSLSLFLAGRLLFIPFSTSLYKFKRSHKQVVYDSFSWTPCFPSDKQNLSILLTNRGHYSTMEANTIMHPARLNLVYDAVISGVIYIMNSSSKAKKKEIMSSYCHEKQ
jgi:hypothetical protein